MRIHLRANGWGFIAYWIADYWLDLIKSKTNPNTLALVRMDLIGDFVLWLDTAKEFRRQYPRHHITLIGNSAWTSLAKELSYWDSVWDVDAHRLARDLPYRWSLLLRVRRAGFATIIQPTYSRTFMHGDSVVRASHATERIGSSGDLSNISYQAKRVSDRWYTRLIPAQASSMMELERNAEFFRRLVGRDFRAALPVLTRLPSADIQSLEQDYFVLFPGASWTGKRWPWKSFATLARQLHQRYGWQLLLCGGPLDHEICSRIARECGISCTNLAGKTSVSQLAEIIRNARLLVSNDTSAVHIGAAVGAPTVCILGGGHHGRFLPYPADLAGLKPQVADHPMTCFQCNWRCTQPHAKKSAVPCVANVSVEQVLHLSREVIVLQTSKKPHSA